MRKSDAARPDEAAHAADSSVAKAEIAGPSRQTPAVDPVAVEPPGPLPSLENLTAESDLTAFIREGVPESLKKAALRKMWLLEQAIRDHVGLAECDRKSVVKGKSVSVREELGERRLIK